MVEEQEQEDSFWEAKSNLLGEEAYSAPHEETRIFTF